MNFLKTIDDVYFDQATRVKGGPGSGFFGHAGIPGHQGGSARSGISARTGRITSPPILPLDARGYIKKFIGNPVYFEGLSQPERDKVRGKLMNNIRSYLNTIGTEYKTEDVVGSLAGMMDELRAGGVEDSDFYKRPEVDSIFNIYRLLEKEYEFRLKREISRGNLDPSDAYRLGGINVSEPNGHEWADLPPVLYHATSNSASIIKEGLKSRRERSGSASGLGGGEDDTISLTRNWKIAQSIERGLHEMHMAATGRISVRDMINSAREGAGGVGRDWTSELAEATGAYFGKSDDILGRLLDVDEGRGKKYSGWFRPEDSRPYTRDEINDNRISFMKSYQWAREHAGGYNNPYFMFNDAKALARLDPRNFAVHVYKPRYKDAKGTHFPGEEEYRIVGGDVVEFSSLDKGFTPGDKRGILGW